jgi:FMN phosphatase YigB (HAD superfamily)
MPLSLEQYATWLDNRSDLLWPAAPEVRAPKAKAHLKKLPNIRVVTWSVYGTLLAISGGELFFVHPENFIMATALEKTIQEFKMWQAMSRKPGKPSEYMRKIYEQVIDEARMARATSGERFPEIRADDLWERIVKRLIKNEYQFDVAFYGSLNQLGEKIGYFFHSSMQGTGPEPGALECLLSLKRKGLLLGLVGDGQCFTALQLMRALGKQGKLAPLADLFDPELVVLSFDVGARRPSERLFRAAFSKLAARGISPGHVLHVGASLPNDLVPAKRLGFHTAMFAGDKTSVAATNEQLQDKSTRPDVMITELAQLAEVVG